MLLDNEIVNLDNLDEFLSSLSMLAGNDAIGVARTFLALPTVSF